MLKISWPNGKQLNDDPLIVVFDDVISKAHCEELIEQGRRVMKRAVVSGKDGGVTIAGRTNSAGWVPHTTTPTLGELADQLADLVGLPRHHAEAFQVVHYDTGQEYRAHFDAYDPTTERGRRCMVRGGQRLATIVGYLRDVPRGGSTAFPTLGVEIKPKQGRVVLFHSCSPGSVQRHRDSLHGGTEVTAGEKWSFNLWFHESRFQR